MALVKTSYGRRSFLKATALAGGGMMIGFSWLASCQSDSNAGLTLPKEWFDLNGFLKVGDNGLITLMSPNPEFGSNVKTSMPMILADELDTDWKNMDGKNMVTGKPMFSMDDAQERMLIAMIAHPPAFGMKVKSVDDAAARSMPGIKDVFTIKTLADDYERNGFDTTTFTELVAVAGNSTWEVINAK